jgi:hypothetical protein
MPEIGIQYTEEQVSRHSHQRAWLLSNAREAWKPTSTGPTRPGLYHWAWVVRPVETTGGNLMDKHPIGRLLIGRYLMGRHLMSRYLMDRHLMDKHLMGRLL